MKSALSERSARLSHGSDRTGRNRTAAAPRPCDDPGRPECAQKAAESAQQRPRPAERRTPPYPHPPKALSRRRGPLLQRPGSKRPKAKSAPAPAEKKKKARLLPAHGGHVTMRQGADPHRGLVIQADGRDIGARVALGGLSWRLDLLFNFRNKNQTGLAPAKPAAFSQWLDRGGIGTTPCSAHRR
jgi:hypothetical protein